MAGTTVRIRPIGRTTSVTRQLVIEMNKLIADVELLRAAIVAMAVQIDADNGTIGTDYAAAATITAIDTAAELTAAKIGDDAGTAYSA
jgi:hypothetical protein